MSRDGDLVALYGDLGRREEPRPASKPIDFGELFLRTVIKIIGLMYIDEDFRLTFMHDTNTILEYVPGGINLPLTETERIWLSRLIKQYPIPEDFIAGLLGAIEVENYMSEDLL